MGKRTIAIFIILAIALGVGYYTMAKGNGTMSNKVILKTNMGDITIELYGDMPVTSGNFEKLVKQGFYHFRIMIQSTNYDF